MYVDLLDWCLTVDAHALDVPRETWQPRADKKLRTSTDELLKGADGLEPTFWSVLIFLAAEDNVRLLQ